MNMEVKRVEFEGLILMQVKRSRFFFRVQLSVKHEPALPNQQRDLMVQ